MKYELIIVGALETNCYLVYCKDTLSCAVIDPGAEPDKIFPVIAGLKLKPIMVLNTHGHTDHVGANRDIIDRFHVPLLIHAADEPWLKNMMSSELSLLLDSKESPPPDRFLKDRETIRIGTVCLKVIHTPGHTPGSVGFLGPGIYFSGDTLFNGGVGRTDLPGGDYDAIMKSIKTKLFMLPNEVKVHSGHGIATTIGYEKRSNPFLQ